MLRYVERFEPIGNGGHRIVKVLQQHIKTDRLSAGMSGNSPVEYRMEWVDVPTEVEWIA